MKFRHLYVTFKIYDVLVFQQLKLFYPQKKVKIIWYHQYKKITIT
jgi:hypothetical protein